jgi:thiamine biosynthesis lipoprotein
MTDLRSFRRPDRREFIALGLGAFVVAAVPLAERRRRLVRRTMPVMGTIAQLAVVHRDTRYAHAAMDAALAVLVGVERDMTRFRPGSDIGRVNRLAAREPVPVTARTARVVAEALRWAEASAGRFDPAIGGAIELWDVNHRSAPPGDEHVRAFAGRRLHRAVEIGSRGVHPVIRLHDPDARLDLGAIAKGFGVDEAVRVLRDWGVTDAVVCAGGDLYAMGHALDGESWRVGIRDPLDGRRLAGTLTVSEQAVATSGDYEQYFRYRGLMYHHLLDPDTGAPRRTSLHSDTVIAASCMEADAASTTVFGLEPAAANRLLARCGAHARLVRVL